MIRRKVSFSIPFSFEPWFYKHEEERHHLLLHNVAAFSNSSVLFLEHDCFPLFYFHNETFTCLQFHFPLNFTNISNKFKRMRIILSWHGMALIPCGFSLVLTNDYPWNLWPNSSVVEFGYSNFSGLWDQFYVTGQQLLKFGTSSWCLNYVK